MDKLVGKCNETVEEVRVAKKNLYEDEKKHKWSSCMLYIVFFSMLFIINVGVGTYYVYFHWYLKKMIHVLNFVLLFEQ